MKRQTDKPALSLIFFILKQKHPECEKSFHIRDIYCNRFMIYIFSFLNKDFEFYFVKISFISANSSAEGFPGTQLIF